jgi:DNA-binding NarL/FixJ family response regulator
MMEAMVSRPSSTTSMVGRAADLDQLRTLIGLGNSAPNSQVVLLAGDAGVGKTRLLTELGQQAGGAGWRVVKGHCLDFGDSAPPYLPFSEVFSSIASDYPALAASVIRAFPALASLVPARSGLDGGTGAPPRMEPSDLFEAVHAGLTQIAGSAPLLVVVEDLHWADHSTREMLSFLFARRFAAPVAVIGSYRSDDLHRRHPLRAAVGEWARLPGVARLQLQPLTDTDVRHLVRSLHPASISETKLSGIVARAEGNAFFVEELVAAADMAGSSLPTDLVDLLLVRVDRLDEDVRLVVRTASVAGRKVSHQLLARVVDLDDVSLDRSLRAAVEANVLVPVAPDAYAFRHALLAEAIYDDLLPGERVRLHAAYTRVLAAGEAEGTAAELAGHARAGHDTAIALRASIQAGDEAMALAGPAEAAHQYEHALEILADRHAVALDPPVDSVALALRAGDASVAAGNVYRAIALFEDQLRQLPPDASDIDRASLLLALAGAALQAETSIDALQATAEAVRLIPAEPASALRARAVNMHARTNADRRRDDDAAQWARLAVELGRQLHLPEVVADATTTIARIDERAGAPELSRQALEEAVTHATEAGDAAAELRALAVLAGIHYAVGHLPEAAKVSYEAVERAVCHGRPWAPYSLDARVLGGIVAYDRGDWDEALRIADVHGESPPGLAEALLGSVGMAVAAGRGQAQAVKIFPQIRAWWTREGQIAILSAGAAIDLYGDAGQLDEAIAVYDDVLACIAELWDMPHFQAQIRFAGLLLGQLSAAAGRSASSELTALAARGDDLAETAWAAAQHNRQLGRPEGIESAAWLARVSAEQLRLHWLTGVDAPDEDALIAAWRLSVEVFEQFGHPFETARSQARLAAVLRAAGQSEEADTTLALARETATQLGAVPLLAELRAIVPGAVARRPELPHGQEALTGREEEVLALLATGRSNRAIGEQLYISAHVSNLMAKLGAHGRTEAVAIARRRGLLDNAG